MKKSSVWSKVLVLILIGGVIALVMTLSGEKTEIKGIKIVGEGMVKVIFDAFIPDSLKISYVVIGADQFLDNEDKSGTLQYTKIDSVTVGISGIPIDYVRLEFKSPDLKGKKQWGTSNWRDFVPGMWPEVPR